MSLHVIVGAGATGRATALLLAEEGVPVRLVSRSGRGPVDDRIERVAADAADPAALRALTAGAAVLVNAAMPSYDRWPQEWPPLAASLLGAAESAGADYVMLGNAYGYGPVAGPMTPDLPMAPTGVKGRVRARMWLDALAAHEAGRVRVTEVRASDYLGAGAVSPFTLTVSRPLLEGLPVAYPGDPDLPHSWSYTGDAARTLAAAARSPHAWGRAWHVPSSSESSAAALAGDLAAAAGLPAPVVTRVSRAELEELGRHDPIMAEIPEMLYLTERPSLLDASETERILGVTATPVETVLKEMAAPA
ncbi:NAD-dependent epimerase/dehydratase family protein [Actinocorallia aurea]